MVSMCDVLKSCVGEIEVSSWCERERQTYRQGDLLIRVERQAGQLALDQVGAVLHDRLQFDVPVRALPARHQVQHVDAARRLAVLDALPVEEPLLDYCLPSTITTATTRRTPARELHADAREQGQPRGLVAHSQEPCVEVDLRCQRGDCDQARVPDEQEGRDCLLFFFGDVKTRTPLESQEKKLT